MTMVLILFSGALVFQSILGSLAAAIMVSYIFMAVLLLIAFIGVSGAPVIEIPRRLLMRKYYDVCKDEINAMKLNLPPFWVSLRAYFKQRKNNHK